MANSPRILAIETSSRIGSVLLARGPEVIGERTFSSGFRHAVDLMPAIQQLCAEAGWRGRDLEQVYLSQGPGSFTGLRVAVAVARSLHLATGCRLVGVPTVDVIARNAPPEVQHLIVVLDAKRGQVFAARYAWEGGELVRTAGPVLADPAAFLQQTPRPAAVIGEGVDYHRAALQGTIEVDRALWTPTARQVHAWGWTAAQKEAFANPATLLPIYIRLAEAEELYNQRHGLP